MQKEIEGLSEEFRKLDEDIFLLGEPIKNPSLKPLVVVHSYWGEPSEKEQTQMSETALGYRTERDKILRESAGKRNVFYFEWFKGGEKPHTSFAEILEQRVRPSFSDGLFVVRYPTWGFDDFFRDGRIVNFVRQYGNHIEFIGGNYYSFYNPLTWKKDSDGCLAAARRYFALQGVRGRLIEEAVFPEQKSEEVQIRGFVSFGLTKKYGEPWKRKYPKGLPRGYLSD